MQSTEKGKVRSALGAEGTRRSCGRFGGIGGIEREYWRWAKDAPCTQAYTALAHG